MPQKTLSLNWELTSPQWEFFNSNAKFRAFISGIGAGKTTVGIMACLKEAVDQAGSIGVVVAPTYPLIRDVLYPEMEKWIPPELVKDFSRHENTLELRNGSIIRFRSAQDDRQIERLRGASLAWVWVDEATLLPKLVWNIMIGRLRQINFDCRAWVTGTPRGFDWVYDLFVAHPIADSYILSNVPTRSNIYLSEEYFRSLEAQYSGQFARQELQGEFVRFEGLVYPDFTPSMITEEDPHRLDRVAYALDWGFTNPSVILALGEVDGVLYILEEFHQTRVTDDELISIAHDLERRWGPGTFYCDPSSPASIEKFNRVGLSAEKAINDVNAGIRAVSSLIASDRFRVHARCRNTLMELNMYSYAPDAPGRPARDTPVKVHDHAMDALRYGIMGLRAGEGYSGPTLTGEIVSAGRSFSEYLKHSERTGPQLTRRSQLNQRPRPPRMW